MGADMAPLSETRSMECLGSMTSEQTVIQVLDCAQANGANLVICIRRKSSRDLDVTRDDNVLHLLDECRNVIDSSIPQIQIGQFRESNQLIETGHLSTL